MSFKDYALDILRGGLPQVLDNPNLAGSKAKGDNSPEKVAPAAKITDMEPALLAKMRADPVQAAIWIGGSIAALLLVVYLVKKM